MVHLVGTEYVWGTEKCLRQDMVIAAGNIHIKFGYSVAWVHPQLAASSLTIMEILLQEGMVWRQNNQLCCYDSSFQTFKSTECSGDVPSPRHSASTAVMKDKVWLYGGITNLKKWGTMSYMN